MTNKFLTVCLFFTLNSCDNWPAPESGELLEYDRSSSPLTEREKNFVDSMEKVTPFRVGINHIDIVPSTTADNRYEIFLHNSSDTLEDSSHVSYLNELRTIIASSVCNSVMDDSVLYYTKHLYISFDLSPLKKSRLDESVFFPFVTYSVDSIIKSQHFKIERRNGRFTRVRLKS